MSKNRNSLHSRALKCAGVVAVALLATAGPAAAWGPAGTAFTYQAELSEAGSLVDETCEFDFSLWDDSVTPPGVQVGSTISKTIAVVGGRFTTSLDFGVGIFAGDATWLEIALCCSPACAPATLATRQELTPAPYALFALDGNEGPIGPQGPQGIQGDQGDPGDSHWLLNGSDTYYNAGNVGIGTNAPEGVLHLYGPGAEFGMGARIIFGDDYASGSGVVNTFVGEFGWETETDSDQLQVHGKFGIHLTVGAIDIIDAVFVDATGEDSGLLRTNGPNSINTVLTHIIGFPDNGALGVLDSAGAVLAGMWVNSDGDGYVFSDVSSAGVKSFKIDHPLDPANKYLYHSVVESPDMMNVYNGNVVTDANGQAWVELPAYFQALNRDYRYQLTVIGQFAQAIVETEIEDNRFGIRTDEPNVKVSWQVTGIRQDAFANARRVQVEVDKTGPERGRYLRPELFGQSADMRVPGKAAQVAAPVKE